MTELRFPDNSSFDSAAAWPFPEELAQTGFWAFGYGSLIWDPGFEFTHSQMVRVCGYHRRFCLYSTHYRGSHDYPGLVLALERGGQCWGRAFFIPPELARTGWDYLIEREAFADAYTVTWVKIVATDCTHGDRNCPPVDRALSFVINHNSPQSAGPLPVETVAHRIARAQGLRGPNADYLFNTVAGLKRLGIRDRSLEVLEAVTRAELEAMAQTG